MNVADVLAIGLGTIFCVAILATTMTCSIGVGIFLTEKFVDWLDDLFLSF